MTASRRTKVCTQCGMTYKHSKKWTVAQFELRTYCTSPECRRKARPASSSPRIIPRRSVQEQMGNAGFVNARGAWRPVGFSDEPVIPHDYTLEALLMGYLTTSDDPFKNYVF